MLFADDIVICSESHENLQEHYYYKYLDLFGLIFSQEKSEFLGRFRK